MQWLLIIALVAAVAHCQPPIPRRELGFVYNKDQAFATLKLAAFIDLACPGSKAAFLTLSRVMEKYRSQVQLRFYLFSLPYHRNSHTLAKAAKFLDSWNSPKGATAFDWFTAVYNNIEPLLTPAAVNKTDTEILDFLAHLAGDVAGISSQEFLAGMSNESFNSEAKLEFKYGCTRGVHTTPMFMINDVFVNAEYTWTPDQWGNLIDSVIG